MGNIIVIDTETVTGTYGLLSVGAVVLERDGGKITPLDTYIALRKYLENCGLEEITMTLEQIAEIVGGLLQSTYDYINAEGNGNE